MRVAQRIQEKIPSLNPRISKFHFSLYARLEQSKAVGGDMYSYFVKKKLPLFYRG